jgi:hypothetical protein
MSIAEEEEDEEEEKEEKVVAAGGGCTARRKTGCIGGWCIALMVPGGSGVLKSVLVVKSVLTVATFWSICIGVE